MTSSNVLRDALAAVGAVGGQVRSFDELAAGAGDALRQASTGLTSAGAAAFLATTAVESAWFRTTTEYGTGQRYAPFVGRTFIQLTWEPNYRGFGAWCRARGLVADGDVFVKNPGTLSDLRWAWLGAVYLFEAQGLWPWANAGNFLAVSQAVNGGNGRVGTSFTPAGWKQRQAMYAVFAAAGNDLLPPGATPTTPGDDPLQSFAWPAGTGSYKIVLPVGKASALVAQAWLSLACDGNLKQFDVWFQTDTGISEAHGPLAKDQRKVLDVPDGCTQITIHYVAGGPVGATVETRTK